MEGAAFMFACLSAKANFLQIRAISNYVGDRNKINWNIKKAVDNLNNVLSRIIESYKNND